MVIASLVYLQDITLPVSVSSDLWNEFFDPQSSPHYVKLTLPSYIKYQEVSFVAQCANNSSLEVGSVGLPSNFFKSDSVRPYVNSVIIEPYFEKIPQADTLILSLKPNLYEELNQLSTEEQLSFLKLKFHIEFNVTVLNLNQIIYPSFCQVFSIAPEAEFSVISENTQVVLIPDSSIDTEHAKSLDDNSKLDRKSFVTVKLQSLTEPVPTEFISPPQQDTADNDIFAFVQPITLLELGIPSGSFVRLTSQNDEILVQLFVLFSPNPFEKDIIYVSPRVRYMFMNENQITIKKTSLSSKKLPVANSVTLSRIGCPVNAQRIYQDIISHQLGEYFNGKQRVVRVGDLIPVTFDSNYASIFSEQIKYSSHDTLVWFKVEEIQGPSTDQYYIIDSSITRLTTENIVSKDLMPVKICDCNKYYDLSPLFYYDENVFPYALQFRNILSTASKCFERGITMGTTIILHSLTPNVGKTMLTKSLCNELGFHLIHIDCLTLTANTAVSDATNKTIGYIRAKIETVLSCAKQAVIYISHLEAILENEQAQQDNTGSKLARLMNVEMANLITEYTEKHSGIIFVGSTNDIDGIPPLVRSKIKFELEVPVPTEDQRLAMFEWYFNPAKLNRHNSNYTALLSKTVKLRNVALQSAGLTPLDIKSIVQASKRKSYQNVKNGVISITESDITAVINIARDRLSDSIGAPKIPNVTWEDIGGMEMVKGEIMDTIDMPLKHPELFSSGMKKRSGILFYGPPGTGKTLLAKAIASNFSLNFFSVKGPELLNMYIGESEANVRRVFQRARDAKPCVIFFDELDSVAPKRGNQGDSGGVIDRIVSQLLAELDGMSSGGDGVFVVGATNRPDLLDEALLRPGRFDKMLYLGISDTDEKQANIIKALTRKFTLAPGVEPLDIAKTCPFNYTGADFYALCSDALLNAMTRIAGEVDKKWEQYKNDIGEHVALRYWFDKVAKKSDLEVIVTLEDFELAKQKLIPSVSEDELNHYLKLKHSFESE